MLSPVLKWHINLLKKSQVSKGMKSGRGGGTKETQGAVGAYLDILLFPAAQILMRLGMI